MPSKRERIIEYLKQHPVATSRDLSRLLKVSLPDVRHHLRTLQSQGSISVIGQQPASGKGRPMLLYALASSTAQHNLNNLASVLLARYLENSGSLEQPARLHELAVSLAQPASLVQKNPTRRIYAAIQHLNQMSYQAAWEARPGKPHVMFGHCPYISILADHPILCQLDTALVEALTGGSAVLLARRLPMPQGQFQCIFQVDFHPA